MKIGKELCQPHSARYASFDPGGSDVSSPTRFHYQYVKWQARRQAGEGIGATTPNSQRRGWNRLTDN